jgi:hypothetical protein
MRQFLVATAALTLMCGPALAQGTTGPANQGDNMNKPGMSNGAMKKGATDKGSMREGTTGMDSGMKPDASGQGGSGPGSDQGGTKVAPKNMK